MGEWAVSAGESQLEHPDADPVAALEGAFVDFLAVYGRPVPGVEVLDHVIPVGLADYRMLVGDERVVETDVTRHGASKGRVLLFQGYLETGETTVGDGQHGVPAVRPLGPLSLFRVQDCGLAAFPSASFS